MENYNEVIEEMLDMGKTPEAIYHDVLSIVKERNLKREKSKETFKAAVKEFVKSQMGCGNQLVEDGIYDAAVDFIKKTAEEPKKEEKKSSYVNNDYRDSDFWMNLLTSSVRR